MNAKAYISDLVRSRKNNYDWLHDDLISARSGVTIEHYLFQTYVITLFSGIFCALAGYITADTIASMEFSTTIYDIFNIYRVFPNFVPMLIFRLVFTGAAFIAGAILGYQVMVSFPSLLKSQRGTRINLTLHNAVAYMYAMQRGGAELSTIFSSLAENAAIFGEVAVEFRQFMRDIDYFGYDLVSAIKHLGDTTPSEKFRDFLQDLLSVIDSGASQGEFFSQRVRIYQDEARFEMKQFIATLEFVAETYVTLFVAGPLFLIIIMIVMGIIGGMGLTALSVVCYALIPIGSVLFIVFLSMISEKVEGIERYIKSKVLDVFFDVKIQKREGEEAAFAQLKYYDRIRKFREFMRNPFAAFILIPTRSFYVTVPIAIMYALLSVLSVPFTLDLQTKVMILDDHIVIAGLIVFVPYAIFHLLWQRKVMGIESAIPEFLERMAGINEIGLTIAQGLALMVRTNLGVLSYEIKRIKRDLDWGANIEDALVRFEHRIRTPSIARTVTLITKASYMSGDIGEILAIAASDARMSEILKRERSTSMLIYLVIVYLAFGVFLFVVGVILTMFLPLLVQQGGNMAAMRGMASSQMVSGDTFGILIYHACLIQALFSGLLAGFMGEGSLNAGVKHSCVLLIIALIVFNTFITV
ncbi:MAG TPA: type II secretion system F family protein [Methanomicrobiales archaeon]|jgi:flagellar protein FlaJ|nr:type II secretion system F family protein [Methanomicrobiales archaeon]